MQVGSAVYGINRSLVSNSESNLYSFQIDSKDTTVQIHRYLASTTREKNSVNLHLCWYNEK